MYPAKRSNDPWTLIVRIPILLIFLFGFLTIISGCSKNDYSTNNNNNSATPGINEIFLQGMAFSPVNKTVSIGTTLKWINKDGVNHTVTSGVPGSPNGIFGSGNFGKNGEFSFTFNQAGTFKYYCNIHSSMTGTITVQ